MGTNLLGGRNRHDGEKKTGFIFVRPLSTEKYPGSNEGRWVRLWKVSKNGREQPAQLQNWYVLLIVIACQPAHPSFFFSFLSKKKTEGIHDIGSRFFFGHPSVHMLKSNLLYYL